MILKQLQNSASGDCLVVGHGESIFKFPWLEVAHIPKILVNHFDNYKNVKGIVSWDKDIFKETLRQRDLAGSKALTFYSGIPIEQKEDVFVDPSVFPPARDNPLKIFSGARAIYLAQYLGYNTIYLVGFDFIPHTTALHLAQQHEVNRQKEDDTVPTSLQTQIDNFKNVVWLHHNVIQTNRSSKLKYFKFGDIPCLKK